MSILPQQLFYSLPAEERKQLVAQIRNNILLDLQAGSMEAFLLCYSSSDTYIRKAAYLATGRLYREETDLRNNIVKVLQELFTVPDEKIRQSVINAAGEIAMHDFSEAEKLLEQGLYDKHHSVKNAVIGSLKKAGRKNPVPVLSFARRHLHHPDKEIRRQIVHGIELRGRTHPQEVLPVLQELEFEKTARVRNMIIHVLGQISYKKDCLDTVLEHLKGWKNKELVNEVLPEIIQVHENYRDFSVLSPDEARSRIQKFSSDNSLSH